MHELLLGCFAAALLLTTVVALDALSHYSVVYILRKRDVGVMGA